MASAEKESPAAIFGLDCCTSNRHEIVHPPIMSLAFNFVLLDFLTFVLCAIAACSAMGEGGDLASYEGKYPSDLFNKTVVVNGQAIGHVAKETDDQIVVFSDSGNLRFDVPKSKVALSGGSVALEGPLEPYAVGRDEPMPEGASLRPPAEGIQQKAGEAPEEPSLPVEQEGEPSIVEERIRDVAGEFKSVGRELEQAARAASEKMKDVGGVAASDMEEAARRATSGTKEIAQTGATTAKEKIAAAQSSTQAGLSADNALKIEKESSQPPTELDLAAYEGRYPGDLFNRTVVMNGLPIGRVVKETDDMIVVFSDIDSSIRFDIPKSEIVQSGGSVVANEGLLFRYRARRDAPMPPGSALRPSAENTQIAAAEPEIKEERRTTPDSVMEEGEYLATVPRPETAAVSRQEEYVAAEPEVFEKITSALAELKEIIVAGTKAAKKKVRKAQARAADKQAEADAETISKMGDLATKFAGSFEDVLSEIRTRTYADQERIYTGFLKLIDQQRGLVAARRDLAVRLKDSVGVPVVEPDARRLDAPPELPEDVSENRTTTERRSKTTIRKRRRTRRRKKS